MWKEIDFPDTIVKNGVGRRNQINASEIQPSGKYPVIDQGQDFIAGYCDDEKKLIREELPFVIFGDHTRCFKFIDFPFILGADGTKVLKPNPDLFDPKFYYFTMLSLNIQNRGYNRHFTLLKEKKVPRPEFAEQRRIAHILTTVQTAIEQQARLIALTRELKSALMRKLFTEGLKTSQVLKTCEVCGENHRADLKHTEIGLVPEGWTTTQIGNIAKLQSGGTPSRDNPKFWTGGTIPWVKTTEINYRVIEATQEFITEEGLDNSAAKVLPKGTLLAAMYGQGVTRGRVGILGLDAATNQACAAITPFDEKQVLTWFLYYYMQFHYQDLRDLGHGANQRNLNMDLIKSFPFSFPEMREQQGIIDSLSTFDKKLSFIEQKHDLLEELFRTLLHQLMTGQIRVADVDLTGLEDL